MLVGTRLGVIAQRIREKAGLFSAFGEKLENLGTYANDAVARQLIQGLCLPGKAFVDVGAHIGSVVDGVLRNSRPSIVIAVEAIPAKAEALRRRFPSALIHSCAVGAEEGELPFFIDLRESGYSSLCPPEGDKHIEKIVVPVRRLDDLIGVETIDIIKIDVEGFELAALRGTEAIVARCRPTIMFESGPGEVGGHSKIALWEWLDRAGYAVLVPNRVAHDDPGLSRDGFLEAHLYPRRTTNFFAVSRTRREEIRARARSVQRFA